MDGFWLPGSVSGKRLITDVIDEVQVKSSGYNAEFGGANSGIIQEQLRTGTPAWKASANYTTDNIGLQSKSKAFSGDKRAMIAAIHDALYASKICSYAQGMNLIRAGSENWNWGIDLGELSRIWKGGCIIRAQFLDKIKQAYQRRADLRPGDVVAHAGDAVIAVHQASRGIPRTISVVCDNALVTAFACGR